MKIDPGAVGKGFAVDRAVEKLKARGIASCLINAGGQIHCLGTRFGRPWKVAVKDPRGKGVVRFLELSDRVVATSGDYEQFFEVEGRRYSHILDPRTGYPADAGTVSATVEADDGLTADCLATAVVVLGKTKGEALVAQFTGARVTIIEQ